MISRGIDTKIIGNKRLVVVQKKLTPFKKPKNKGGSPSGVSAPPILETRKIKNTNIWTLLFLSLFDLINGLINNIDAPVVPIHEAKIVPINNIEVFN